MNILIYNETRKLEAVIKVTDDMLAHNQIQNVYLDGKVYYIIATLKEPK